MVNSHHLDTLRDFQAQRGIDMKYKYIIISVVIFISLAIYYIHGDLIVVVQNQTSAPITNLRIDYTGGSLSINNIEPRQEVKKSIYPSGESDLTISYFTEDTQYSQKVNVYIEPSYSGRVTISIIRRGEISIRHKISVK